LRWSFNSVAHFHEEFVQLMEALSDANEIAAWVRMMAKVSTATESCAEIGNRKVGSRRSSGVEPSR